MWGLTVDKRLKLMGFNFSGLAKTEKNSRLRVRLLALSHASEGESYTDIANMLKVHFQSVRRWIKNFLDDGFDGLKEKKGRGKKPLLSQNQEAELLEEINSKYNEMGGGRLFGYDIQKIIEEKFDIKCSLSATYNVLHRAGLVWITARSKHPQADVIDQEEFKKNYRKC